MRNITFVPKVIMMPIDMLQAAAFQPARRTDDAAQMRRLEEGILEAQGIIQPIIVSNDNRVIDGHRRLQAAKNLGYVEVPVIVSPLSLQVGWRVLNNTSLRVQSGDWACAHYLGMSIENMPRIERKRILEIKRLMGDDGFADLVHRGMATGVLNEARGTARYIEGKSSREPVSDATVICVLAWMIKYGQQTPARSAIRQGMDPRLLKYSVENGLEIKKEHA